MPIGVAAAPLAFFSFPEVVDPERHRDYNAWHQLDHLPENRALPGVVHGERWVRTPACRAASVGPADPTLDATQYVAMYWFAPAPGGSADAHVEEWRALGESTRQEGRRPELDWTVRRFTDFFRPETGVVAPEALVSVGALPFRPHRGVVIDVGRVVDPGVPAPPPELAPGVAGAWTFTGGRDRDAPPHGRLRITLHYCESDPLEVVEAMGAPAAPGVEPLLRTPLLPVVPWEWDWFESEETDGPA
ncbi:hypothetical protein [Nocardioides sp. YIM 152315]|uniref:hypothetical protein n=1 Tax=Nocardioides sp. YIM 152315 TaxID=3031760 RepID=UPI0023DC5E82|nr:hypothetical protein [Nocardioides sp. YIM 152315]MDF1604722.1 hypothetical protein [Nocardioides sp. YIM 152315]